MVMRVKKPWEYASAAEEIEALRAELMIEKAVATAASEESGEQQAELERLRKQNDNYDERHRADQAELERLRRQDEGNARMVEIAQAEVERLREELDTEKKAYSRLLTGLDARSDSPVIARLRRIEEAAPLALKALQLCAANYADHSFEETDEAILALRATLEAK